MLFVLLWAPAAARELSIINFGAEPVEPVSRGPRASKFGEGEANATRAVLNGKALYDAMRSARKGDVVVVPAEQRFVMVPYAPLYRLEHVVLRLEGCLAAFEPQPGEHAKVWPFYLGNFESLITIHLSSHVTISGGGALDGRGHNWWVAFARNKLASKRPMLLQIDGSTDIVVRDITMLDSPRFNLYLGSYCRRVLVERVTILADWQAQEDLQKSVPMFPFNTDGIDVAGEDITIRDIVVSNYDDVVAVKAADLLSDKTRAVPGCTQNVTIYNTTVYRGAGLSVGSVHPSPLKPCVRDVLFEKATLWSPLKGPYVKPDRATPECLHLDHDACSASISNVTYAHIRMHGSFVDGTSPPGWDLYEQFHRAKALAPDARFAFQRTAVGRRLQATSLKKMKCGARDYPCMMWPLYLGPQQQTEPGGKGSGLWADPEPRVDVKDVSFIDVKAHSGSWPAAAAVVRCPRSNPCRGLRFEDVSLDANVFGKGRAYVCDHRDAAFGVVAGERAPDAADCVAAA